MKNEYKKSLANEEILECLGSYDFSMEVTEDIEMLALLNNSFIIALKCIIKQDGKVLGIGRANSVLSPKNKFIKNAVLYCFNASLIDAVSKTVKLLSHLPSKREEKDIGVRNDNDNLKYASQKQKVFLGRLVDQKCNGSDKKEYKNKLESKYFSSYECSALIKNLLTK